LNVLSTIVWSIEHQLRGKFGELWYMVWIKTPLDCSMRECVFCKKNKIDITNLFSDLPYVEIIKIYIEVK
jgi:hypothetical protein